MKVTDPRMLLSGEKREMEANGSVRTVFKAWVKLMKDVGTDVDEFDPIVFTAFYTGYVLANPVIKLRYQEEYRKRFSEEAGRAYYYNSEVENIEAGNDS